MLQAVWLLVLQVVLLASLDAAFRRDAQLAGPGVCCLTADVQEALRCKEAGIPPLQARHG